MYVKCVKCGSQKTHGSRVRSGERTAAVLFLRPVRCRECKERFWVQNPTAYFAAGGVVVFIALVFASVWLIIEQNAADQYISPASDGQLEQHLLSSDTSGHNQPARPAAAGSGGKPPNDTLTHARVKPPSPQMQNPINDHHFTVNLYQESAKNGNSDAQYQLGLLYLTGNGALQDFAEAAKWLKLAAEQGYALAQYELGLVYRMGHGVAVDPVQSYVWLNLAAAAGVQQAVTAREEVMRSLSSKQLAQGQKSSRDWLASKSKTKTSGNGNGLGKTEPKETPLGDADPVSPASASHASRP
ncbi:MAG: sel1 repeat family protein [Nitrosospira sp.]|nr:sel1 repeat family protein [Nitrosospira sp.]